MQGIRGGGAGGPMALGRFSGAVEAFMERELAVAQQGGDRSRALPQLEAVKVAMPDTVITVEALLKRQAGMKDETPLAARLGAIVHATRGLSVFVPEGGGEPVALWDGCADCCALKTQIDVERPPDVWLERKTRVCKGCGATWGIGIGSP